MAAAAVLLFGGDLPATARKAARMVGRLRSLAADLGREFSVEEHLPRRGSIDLKRLANLDDDMKTQAPALPGRREDEPITGNPDETKEPEQADEDEKPDVTSEDSGEHRADS